jgi:hypothetical protein
VALPVATLVALVANVSGAMAEPVPEGVTTAPAFAGRAATIQPAGAAAVPRHPFMAPNERSNLHDDAYQTDSYLRSGPLGIDVQRVSSQQGGLCGSVTFDAKGRIVTVCVGINTVTLRLLDPVTLDSLASYDLPPRSLGSGGLGNPFQNFTGGGYFYLDERDRAVIPTADRHVLVMAQTAAPGFEVARDIDLSGVVPAGDAIISALPDWRGRLWFASRQGVVGTVARDAPTVRVLRTGEPIGNSFAVGEAGDVYIVTDEALYRFEAAADGTPRVVWREVYPNDGTQKPGQSEHGSGTTPTLMGPDLVAITDNADPIDVIAYRRSSGVAGPRELCRAPVFAKGASSTDQSLLTDGRSLLVENNYGYEGPQSVAGGQTTTAGLARVDVHRDSGRCTVAWTSDVVAPSVVPKLALGSGIVYTYTKPGGDASDPWFLTALDFRTGATIYDALAGAGPLFNNNYAPVTIGPDGTAYIGVLGGIVSLRDAAPPRVAPAPTIEVTPAPTSEVAPARQRRVRLGVSCGRGHTVVVTTADPRVRALVVRRGRRVIAARRRPLRVRVRAGRPLAVTTLLDDATRLRRTIGPARCGGR